MPLIPPPTLPLITRTPAILAAAIFAATLPLAHFTQALPDNWPVVGEGFLSAAYIAAAFVIARQSGWQRVISILFAISYPAWLTLLMILFTIVGFLLGLHDEALPGETDRQAFQAAARPALGLLLAASTLAAWAVVLGVCTRSFLVGLSVAAAAATVLILPESDHTLVLWHAALCAVLMGWALHRRSLRMRTLVIRFPRLGAGGQWIS